MLFPCPHCGGDLYIGTRRPTKGDTMTLASSFLNAVGAQPVNTPQPVAPTPQRAGTSSSPARAPSLHSDVLVPLARATVAGVFTLITSTPVSILLTFPKPLAWSAGVSAVAFWLAWRGGLKVSEGTLWRLEEWLGDLDGDGHRGQPPIGREVFVNIVQQGRVTSMVKRMKAPVPEEKLALVAKALLHDGITFSRPGLCNRAQVLSQGEYHTLAAWMEKTGLVVKLPGNKRELSAAGRSALGELIEEERDVGNKHTGS